MSRSFIVLAVAGWFVAASAWLIRTDRPAQATTMIVTTSSAMGGSCAADTDGNGIVDVLDLLEVLGSWGVCPDADGDGFTIADGDCDDTDPEVNPGADEICDGIDNNCDGFIDEDNPTAPDWYLDADGDGYGTDADVVASCEQPEGYADNNLDCDDADPDVNPAADELCDSIDNDCDGQTDENPVDGTTWYRDADADGFGDPNDFTVECTQPGGYVSNDLDCDDENADVHPGAVEQCDGIDNNCDGQIDEGC